MAEEGRAQGRLDEELDYRATHGQTPHPRGCITCQGPWSTGLGTGLTIQCPADGGQHETALGRNEPGGGGNPRTAGGMSSGGTFRGRCGDSVVGLGTQAWTLGPLAGSVTSENLVLISWAPPGFVCGPQVMAMTRASLDMIVASLDTLLGQSGSGMAVLDRAEARVSVTDTEGQS